MTTRAELRAEKPRRPLLRSFRFWIPMGILLLLLLIALAGVLVGKPIYDRAMSAKASLEEAMPLATTAKNQILAGDSEGAKATATKLASLTADAREQTDDSTWKSLEWLPFVGPNLHAVRIAAAVTDDLVAGAVTPATNLSLDAFAPVDGAINLAAISEMQSIVIQAAHAVDEAADDLGGISQKDLVPQVETALTQLTGAVEELQPLLDPAEEIVGVLPEALGAEGPRNYLLMFQGNSEARSLGGNAAAFIVLRAEGGRLSIIQNVSSTDFEQPLPEPVVPLSPEAQAIYGDKIGRYTPDFTMIPDFPAATDILNGWWSKEGMIPFDSVISFDPVALSYLLAATGPVALPTGDQLTSDNAVSLLLNEVYFRYPNYRMQDVFFATAANAVFDKVTSGEFSPVVFISALTRAVDEGRLLYRSNSERETELIAASRMSGILPIDNIGNTVVGVFANDNTASKMSYYLNMSIHLCRAESSVTAAVSLSSSVTPEAATSLPRYITGPYFPPGDISTYLVLYGPPGSTIGEVTIDGAPARTLASGMHLGRPAVKVEVLNHMTSTHTVSLTFEGVTDDGGPLDAWHTPMVRETPVEISPKCE